MCSITNFSTKLLAGEGYLVLNRAAVLIRIVFLHKPAYFAYNVNHYFCVKYNVSYYYYKWEIHVHVAIVATLLLATMPSAKATLLAAIPPYECNSGDSSVRRVGMIFTSASNPILYKGVSVNQAGYASLIQANLGGRTISNARTLIHHA